MTPHLRNGLHFQEHFGFALIHCQYLTTPEFSLTTPCILSEIPTPCSYSIALTMQSNVLLG